MLLEYAGERMPSHIVAEHRDYQATAIAAELLAKLYAASDEPLPLALLPFRDRFAAFFQPTRDDQNAGCQPDYVLAAVTADQTMSNAPALRGLQGAQHHYTIMIPNRGWPAIAHVGLLCQTLSSPPNPLHDPAHYSDHSPAPNFNPQLT
ncbi:aminoglycoside phosphotransferase family protein, partial [Escherichia coli]|uniref:aminoglycoside phosphotransferase family protein n=1 Tax=Escherichia coli TaxID=562 RepID=UPI00098C7ACB